MNRRHDPFLKLLYRAGARDAVTLFFPDLASHIDWAQLQWIETEVPILGPSPRAVVADLVGRTQDVEGHYLNVLIHPEIQMRTEAEMGWRVLQYNAGLTLQQANPNTRVLTLVFYHCRGAGGVRELRHRLEFYGHSTLAVDYWSVGLGDLDADPYVQSDNPMAWALAAWIRHPRRGRAERRVRLLDRILRLVRDEQYRRLLLDAVRTYFRLSAAEQAEEQQLLQSGRYGEVREMLQTELGRLEEQARQQGKQEGQQEGERQALQRALLAIVRNRFPEAAKQVEAQIRREEDPARLEEFIHRALSAATLDEIWPSRGS